MRKQRLVVIGNGMAAVRLLEEILARGGPQLFDIVVFGEEAYGGYNRVLLSGVVAGTHQREDILLSSPDWYSENGVKLHLGVRAGRIDRGSRKVYAAAGLIEPYDKLVIATGGSPIVPPLDNLYADGGGFTPGVFVFRTANDCAQIVDYAANARKAVVIGGGLLGLEAARGLANRGLKVHVVHLAPHLMENQLDPAAGSILKGTLESGGLDIHLNEVSTAILGEGRVTGLAFKDGSSVDCDMVVISAGTRPNVELAKEAGLTVQRGIVVHDDLSCRNDPSVYAIGDCIQHRDRVYGLVAPALEQAEVLAERLTGEEPKATYTGSRLATKLKVMGVELAVMGEKDRSHEDDELVTYVEPSRGIYKKLIVRQGRLAGGIFLGDGLTSSGALQVFDRGWEVPENRSELLFPSAKEAGAPNVSELPDNTRICSCNGVSKGKLVAAVHSGLRTLKEVCDATRAGTGCGSCKSEVRAILELSSNGSVADPGV